MIFADPSGKRWRRVKRGGFLFSALVGIPPLLVTAGGLVYEPAWADLNPQTQSILVESSVQNNLLVAAPALSAVTESPKNLAQNTSPIWDTTTQLALVVPVSLKDQQSSPRNPDQETQADRAIDNPPTSQANSDEAVVPAIVEQSTPTTPTSDAGVEPTPPPNTEPEAQPEPQSPGQSDFGHSHGKPEKQDNTDPGNNRKL